MSCKYFTQYYIELRTLLETLFQLPLQIMTISHTDSLKKEAEYTNSNKTQIF